MPSVECGFGVPDGQRALVVVGPTLHVEIGFDPTYRPSRRPALPSTPLIALVDTGASESCIDNDLAVRLELPVVDRCWVGGVQGRFQTNLYLAQIFVPPLDVTAYGRFAGVFLRQSGQPHYALLGRTFLKGHTMAYNGLTGSVVLTRT